MFKKLMSCIVAAVMVSSVALAAGPKAFDIYVKEVAKESGRSEKEVKEKAIEALRSSGRYSKAELERIGRETVDLDPVKQKDMVSLLKTSKTFRPSLGLVAVRNEATRSEVNEAFGAMKSKDSFDPSKVEAKAAPKKEAKKPTDVVAKDEKIVAEAMEKAAKGTKMEATEARQLKGILKFAGEPAFNAVVSLSKTSPEAYLEVRRFASKISERIGKGTLDATAGKQLIIDVADSTKPLQGKLVTGKGASKACAEMARDAVENFAEFIRGGAIEGKDAETYAAGIAKAMSKRFKQELEDGYARFCATLNAGCGLFNNEVFSGVCKARAAAFAM